MGESTSCSCFKILTEDLPRFEEILRREGFKDVPQFLEEKQLLGLAKNLDKFWQVHVRVYSDGQIKAEVEPRWVYFEHLLIPSYSAHSWMFEMLNRHNVRFIQKNPTPVECINPVIKTPSSLTDWRVWCGKFLAKFVVKRSLKKWKIKVDCLEDLKAFMLKTMSFLDSFTTVNLFELVTLKMETTKLEMKVKCPIQRTHKELCEKYCIPTISSILKVVNKKIQLERKSLIETGECQLIFSM
ncbi:hypothetical protein DRO26_04630 [Candidatus Bathyarchaeota archaeon]|nr:MAG: hypothetical protein DRO26_04630 [Candidatus Bathyarchaeota archaeon]